MKIALIAPGRREIPSGDMVSIEVLIWNYHNYLRNLGHEVDIYNSNWIYDVMYEIQKKKYDFIHLHFDAFAISCNKYLKRNYCVTSHSFGFQKFSAGNFTYYPPFQYVFPDLLEAPGNIVLSEHIKKVYEESGYKGFLRVLRNPVETEKFAFSKTGNGRALCIGSIQPRKKQALLANLLENKVEIDFIGGRFDPMFRENKTAKYLGIWSREELYKRLSEYNSLVLLTESEAAPLSVLEGLAAGLSLVISESASANLAEKPYISLLSDNEENADVIASTIRASISNNDPYREEIREYAKKEFDYTVVIEDYLKIIEEFRDYSR
jgi:glycosyltransferase involved in cell wall biosynthesis